MILGRVIGRVRRRWRRVLAAVAAVSVLSGGGITAYGASADDLIGRAVAGILGNSSDSCVQPAAVLLPDSVPAWDAKAEAQK